MPNIYHDDELKKSGAACSDGASGGMRAAVTPGLLPTPRTDAFADEKNYHGVMMHFARGLERELAEATSRLSEAKKDAERLAAFAKFNKLADVDDDADMSELMCQSGEHFANLCETGVEPLEAIREAIDRMTAKAAQ